MELYAWIQKLVQFEMHWKGLGKEVANEIQESCHHGSVPSGLCNHFGLICISTRNYRD